MRKLRINSVNCEGGEKYVYDPAGNILEKTVNGKKTTFEYDKANQLVSSTTDGKITKYTYDAAGRLVKEGDKNYTYVGLDKVASITEGDKMTHAYNYYIDGQLAGAKHDGKSESFLWDGLALIARNTSKYVNEPAVTGGNPILADGKVLFNDMLGSTLGHMDGAKIDFIDRTAFGASSGDDNIDFFTGKPKVEGLGHAFLFRNYRSELGKWQTQDPLGYPDGWNQFAYVNNWVMDSFDPLGANRWTSNNVDYLINVPKQVAIYGIVSSSSNGAVAGESVLIVWEYTIHGTCSICLGPDCSTGKCYYKYTVAQTVAADWASLKPYNTPILSKADLIAATIGLITDIITGEYWRIEMDNVAGDSKGHITNATPPAGQRISFLGKHCE